MNLRKYLREILLILLTILTLELLVIGINPQSSILNIFGWSLFGTEVFKIPLITLFIIPLGYVIYKVWKKEVIY